MPVRRLVQFLVAATVVSLLTPALAFGGSRMYVGFHDDPNFRFEENRGATLDQARDANATVVRTLVTWASVAPKRPKNAANAFDPAYRFDDLDELVRNTQRRGLEVLLTVWGTPKWANGGKKPNILPKRNADFTNFMRALSSRYSGRNAGYPFVRFYSIWNESNLQLFLSPQFDKKGRSVGPKLYAKLYAAGYAGVKRGNARAKVAIGETSTHGRDKDVKGQSDTHSPGRFAQLVARANPRLKFDAWAHHPYPTPQYLKPTQKVLWPNVSLSSLPRFEQSLDKWFRQSGKSRIWITEYGHETKQDGEKKGISRAKQATYALQAFNIARKDARVDMFIWFVLRDHPTTVWQSGLITKSGKAKPALARFRAAAKGVDIRNAIMSVRGGRAPMVTVPLREYGAGTAAGESVGVNFRVFQKGKLVTTGQSSAPFGTDATVRIPLRGFVPVRKRTYTVQLEANVFSGGGVKLARTYTLLAT
jgi:hypothetical protein